MKLKKFLYSEKVAESIGIPRDEVENYGRYIAKIPEYLIDEREQKSERQYQEISSIDGDIKLDHVTFRYGNKLDLARMEKKDLMVQ